MQPAHIPHFPANNTPRVYISILIAMVPEQLTRGLCVLQRLQGPSGWQQQGKSTCPEESEVFKMNHRPPDYLSLVPAPEASVQSLWQRDLLLAWPGYCCEWVKHKFMQGVSSQERSVDIRENFLSL